MKELFIEDKMKGKAGYLKTMRLKRSLFTLLLFALPIGLYIIGWVQTGTNKNLFTVAAILGCLPAGMSAVNMIMLFLHKPTDPALVAKTENSAPSLKKAYELVVTGYEKTTPIEACVITEDELVCYSGSKKADPEYFRKQLRGIMEGNQIRNLDIRLFTDEKKFLERISALEKKSGEKPVEEAASAEEKVGTVFAVLKAVSL